MRIEQQIVERWDRGAVDAALFPEGKPDTSEDLRFRLGESQNWRCCYCGVVMNRRRNTPELCTIEHVIPASAGGWKCWETCVAACKRCNEIGGKAIWREGWERRLSVPLCPRCGTDNIRFVGRRAIRCNLCARQFSTETNNGHPFAAVPFAALRRVAGCMIVNPAEPPWAIAKSLQRGILALDFLPLNFTEAMAQISAPYIAEARAKTSGPVEVYYHVVPRLRERYSLKMAAAPERGPLCQGSTRAFENTRVRPS